MRRFLLLAALALSACGTPGVRPEPRVVTVEVDRPVATSCVPAGFPAHPPARTATPQALGPHPEPGRVIQAVTDELVQRRAYDDQVDPVMAGCAAAGAFTPR